MKYEDETLFLRCSRCSVPVRHLYRGLCKGCRDERSTHRTGRKPRGAVNTKRICWRCGEDLPVQHVCR